jgi:hypothetical protein
MQKRRRPLDGAQPGEFRRRHNPKGMNPLQRYPPLPPGAQIRIMTKVVRSDFPKRQEV